MAHRIDTYLNPNFEVMYRALRSSTKNSATPMYLNCYDTPVARNAPAIKDKVGPWLYKAYRDNNIEPSLWPSLTRGLFKDIKTTIEGWAASRTAINPVPTTGRLTPAPEGSTGNTFHWRNEIHPNARGWKKQAEVWADVLG